MSNKETSFLRMFIEEKKGNVAVTFGLMAVVMLGAVGAAVDMGRALHAQSKLQTAVDSAATAAAAALGMTPGERTDIARRFFESNNENSFGNAASVAVTVNGPNVTVTANSAVPAGVTKLLGVSEMPISASSEAGTTGKNLEVAMMIDVTGSMSATRGGMTKIDALKLAADDLLDILFPNGASTSGQVRVAVAPMADYVNAGSYAPTATGLPSTGYYANLTNLKSTKNGPSSGNYSGSYGTSAGSQPLGSQQGATPIGASVLPGQTAGATAGQTYASAHCTAPGALGGGGASPMTYGTPAKPMGYWINDSSSNPPAQLVNATSSSGFYHVDKYDEVDGHWEATSNDSTPAWRTSGYYIPIPQTTTGVTYVTRNGPYHSDSYNIGVSIEIRNQHGVSPPDQIKSGRYWRITGWSSSSGFSYASSSTEGWYLPVPASMGGGGGVDPDCTGTDVAPDQPTGTLISCVTERTGSDRYTDEAPGSGGFVGPYNQVAPGKTNNKLNYSQDGKCYTAGRELPAIIPLTNSRTTLESFFTDATVGGSTPGHLGHAWAWYMLSPKWQGVWPQESHPAQYNDQGVMKAAIIMTDGEYNTQYSDASSATQALELCTGMKAAGITVYTIGFGFPASGATTSDSAAKTMLMQCASDATSYFFPYDATALRQAFKDIGAKLTGGASRLVVMK